MHEVGAFFWLALQADPAESLLTAAELQAPGQIRIVRSSSQPLRVEMISRLELQHGVIRRHKLAEW